MPRAQSPDRKRRANLGGHASRTPPPPAEPPPEHLAYRRVNALLGRLDDDQRHRLHCLLFADVLGRTVFHTAAVPLTPAQEEALARFLYAPAAG